MSTQSPPGSASAASTALGQIARNSGWLMLGKIFGALASIVYLALAARLLQPDGFGRFALIIGIAQLFAGLVGVQSWQIIVRYGALHTGQGDAGATRQIVHWCLLIEICGAIAGAMLAILGLHLAAPLFDWSATVTDQAIAFAVVMLACIRSTPMGVLRLDNRFAASAIADAMMPATRLAGAVIVVVTGPSVAAMLMAWAASEAASALSYWLLAARGWTRGVARPGLRAVLAAPKYNPGLIRFAWTTNASTALAAVQQQLPLLAIGSVASAASVGQFRLAHQLGQALRLISEMIARAAFAELSHAEARIGEAGMHRDRLSRGIGRAAIIGAAIMAALSISIGYPALTLIGGGAYAGAYPLLVLVAIAASVDLAAVGYEPALLARGRSGIALGVRAATVLILAIGLLLLLPPIGAQGGAAAMVIASIAALLLGRQAVVAIKRS